MSNSFLGQIQFQPTCKKYIQLPNNKAPIWNWHLPFSADVFDCQVNQFFQCCLAGKRAFGFGNLAYLPVQTFHCIGGINHFSNLRWIPYPDKLCQLLFQDLITNGYFLPHFSSRSISLDSAKSLLFAL